MAALDSITSMAPGALESASILVGGAEEEAKKARSESQKAGQAKLMADYGEALFSKPAPHFSASQEDMSGFAALGSLLAVSGAMMGMKGKTSGIMAMNAISGMMKGYQQGRKDLYEQERQKFEMSMKDWERERSQIKEAFDMALKMAPTNYKGATEFLNKTLASLGVDIPRASLNTNGLTQTAGTYGPVYEKAGATAKQISSVTGVGPKITKDQAAQYGIPELEGMSLSQAKVYIAAKQARTKAETEAAKFKQEQELKTQQIAAEKALVSQREAEAEAKKQAAKRMGLSEQEYNTALALSKNPDQISTDRERDLVAALTGTVYPIRKEPKADEVAGQRKFVRNVIGDEVKDLSPKEVPKVAATIEATTQAFNLADAISKTPEAAGVVGRTISFFDKFLPSRYQMTDEADPDKLAAQAASDTEIFKGIPEDKISEARKIQKMVVDVINARALAASGGSRMLIAEFNAQKNVLGLGDLSSKSAYDLYRGLAERDARGLKQYGLSDQAIQKIITESQPKARVYQVGETISRGGKTYRVTVGGEDPEVEIVQ